MANQIELWIARRKGAFVESILAVKGLMRRVRKRPGKLPADRAYASREHRAWLRRRAISAGSHATVSSHVNSSVDGVELSSAP
jgi:hypothetical protein